MVYPYYVTTSNYLTYFVPAQGNGCVQVDVYYVWRTIGGNM